MEQKIQEIRERYGEAFPEWDGDMIPRVMYQSGREIIPFLLDEVERLMSEKAALCACNAEHDEIYNAFKVDLYDLGHANAAMQAENAQLQRERDAAVAVITTLETNARDGVFPPSPCEHCKKQNASCSTGGSVCKEFKWIGPQEVEHG